MNRTRKKLSFHAARSAFTLIELLVVIAIIGLLSTVAVVALDASRVNARNAKRIADIKQLITAFSLEYESNGSYPDTSADTSGAACISSNSCTGGWSAIGADASLDALMVPEFIGSKPAYPPGGGATAAAGGYLFSYPWGPGTAPYSGITYPANTPLLEYTLEGIVPCAPGIIWTRGSNWTNCLVSVDGSF